MGIANRLETVMIKATIAGGPAAERHKQALVRLGCYHPTLPGDKLHLSYQFEARYYGEVADKLEALIFVLSDPEVVAQADYQELERGRSLIMEVAKHVERLRMLFGAPERATTPAAPARSGFWSLFRREAK